MGVMGHMAYFLPIFSLLHPSVLDPGSGTGQTLMAINALSPPFGLGKVKFTILE